MKTKIEKIERVPTWAIGYLMYGQAEAGLDEEDLAAVQEWERLNPGLRLVDVDWNTLNEFDPFPAFGLACDTATCLFASED